MGSPRIPQSELIRAGINGGHNVIDGTKRGRQWRNESELVTAEINEGYNVIEQT